MFIFAVFVYFVWVSNCFKYLLVVVLFMKFKHSDNVARKELRKSLNARNQGKSNPVSDSNKKKRNFEKESLVDLSKKDNRSGRGRYV